MIVKNKKIIGIVAAVILTVVALVLPTVILAGSVVYQPLAPIPTLGIPSSMTLGAEDGLTKYLDSWVKLLIQVATGLAVLYMVFGGVKYTLSDSFSSKSEAKATIGRALGGLVLALLSYLLLNTINPLLLTGKIKTLADLSVAPVSGGGAGTQSPIEAIPPGGTGTPGGPAGTPTSTGPNQAGLGSGKVAIPTNGFPNTAWNDYALQQVYQSGLMSLNPSDAAQYFPNGQPTAQGWVNLMSGIAKPESSYNPNTTFYENTMGKNSVGLLQLSYDDPEVKALGYSEQDLKDPYKNIQAGTQILERTIREGGGVISGQNSSGKWIGATSYWSALR